MNEEHRISNEETDLEKRRKLADLLNDLISRQFYGKLILTFNAGKIVHAEERKSIKIG